MTDQPSPRRFHLARHEDETGTSGTGVVVEGIEFSDGTIALRWLTDTTSTAVYASIDDVVTIHGHGGKTTVTWLDATPVEDAAFTELVQDGQQYTEPGPGLAPCRHCPGNRLIHHSAMATHMVQVHGARPIGPAPRHMREKHPGVDGGEEAEVDVTPGAPRPDDPDWNSPEDAAYDAPTPLGASQSGANETADPVGEDACPTPCDPDCDSPCHQWHRIPRKRDHDPAQCPGEMAWRERADAAIALYVARTGLGDSTPVREQVYALLNTEAEFVGCPSATTDRIMRIVGGTESPSASAADAEACTSGSPETESARRERYAARIYLATDGKAQSWAALHANDQVIYLTAADAYMAVADEEQRELRERLGNSVRYADRLNHELREGREEYTRLRAELDDMRYNLAQRAFTAPDADLGTMLASLDARITDALDGGRQPENGDPS